MTALAPPLDFAAIRPATRASRWAKARVALTYMWRHGRWPQLDAPGRFTEWVQWRKLNDRDRGLAKLTDKLHAKQFVAGLVGAEMVVPTLWRGETMPDTPPVPLPLMLKANHGCGQFLVIRTGAEWDRAKAAAPRWLDHAYGEWLDEWHYGEARRLLLIEPYIGEGNTLPVDYKVYVFAGHAEIIQVHEDRAGSHRYSQFDRNWSQLSRRRSFIRRPETLPDILAAAEALAVGREFLRVDFYEVGGRALFGEFCLFPGSGLDPFDPVALDYNLGQLWGQARRMLRVDGIPE